MKAMVVYDSVYGNTEKVARAIGSGLEAGAEVQVKAAGDVDMEQLAGMDLLVVGSPTQAFNMIAGPKEFLKSLTAQSLEGVKVAAFDTRISVAEVNSKFLDILVKLFGYAAEKIDKGLKAKGGVQVIAPEGFIVTEKEGPLKEGELERAAAWAGKILRQL